MKSLACDTIAKQIWDWVLEREMWISGEHIVGELNIEADAESRDDSSGKEYKLKPEVFADIVSLFKISPSIDRFASRLNYQLRRFVA